MTNSPDLKSHAISLRKKGLTYSEIQAQIPIAKSTLSDWLHSVGLAKHQKQRITEKKKLAQKLGAAARKKQRVEKESLIHAIARSEVSKLINDPLWLLGVVLYWGEGSKQKPWTTSVAVQFMNMDTRAHKLFIRWAKYHLGVTEDDFRFGLYIHKTADSLSAQRHWSQELSVPLDTIRVYFKHNNLNPKRKNIHNEYYGVLKTSLIKSTDLNRKIAGWMEGVIEYLN